MLICCYFDDPPPFICILYVTYYIGSQGNTREHPMVMAIGCFLEPSFYCERVLRNAIWNYQSINNMVTGNYDLFLLVWPLLTHCQVHPDIVVYIWPMEAKWPRCKDSGVMGQGATYLTNHHTCFNHRIFSRIVIWVTRLTINYIQLDWTWQNFKSKTWSR